MAKSLGSFRAALLIGWGVLGLAGMWYARSRGIPSWAALPVVAAFLIEYPFYLVPAFPAVRERVHGMGVPAFAVAVAVLPYLACCCGAVRFEWAGLARIAAVALAVGLWYVVLPAARVTGVAFLGLVGAVLLGGYFNPIYAPLHPEFKDLKNVIVIPHLSLISMAVMALMLQRRVPETGYGFIPNRREWRIGLLHFLCFVPVGLPLALLLHATHFATPKPAFYIAGTFVGMFCVVSLSEEFFVRGVLQGWIEEWIRSRAGALLVTSAIFGLLHLGMGGRAAFPNWKWALVAGVLGWFCGHARNQAGSIRASMVTHALVATTWRAFFA
jgi:membrane protease YdiL (CAAX protease family)